MNIIHIIRKTFELCVNNVEDGGVKVLTEK